MILSYHFWFLFLYLYDINKIFELQQLQQMGVLDSKNLQGSYLLRFFTKSNTNTTQFINSSQNVTISYEQIFYPFSSDSKWITKDNQIQNIQHFVKTGVQNKKRIRGSGMRHSFSNIFADPNQLMVSFYPSYVAAGGTSNDLQKYVFEMIKLQRQLEKKSDHSEHLGMVRYQRYDENLKKHLVKIGASVSNQQLKRWCKKNTLQYPSNTIIVEVNFCSALLTCSHGSGIETQTLADYVNEIEFINYKGDRFSISKKEHPHLIGSAASSLGLLGLVIFVTIQMDKAQIIKTEPRKEYKDDTIPFPRSWLKSKQFIKRKETERKKYNKKDITSWEQKLKKFKEGISKTHCQWFYFPIEHESCYEAGGRIHGENNQLVKTQLKNNNKKYIKSFPSRLVTKVSIFMASFSNFLFNNGYNRVYENSILGTLLMKKPYTNFPQPLTYLNYMDATHFLRGAHNIKVRNFQVLINIPTIKKNGRKEIDYNLIQKIWWEAFEIVEQNRSVVNMVLEMRVLQGSNSTLAPSYGYEYVCSIEILRMLTSENSEEKWQSVIAQIFKVWKNIKDSNNNPVTIRPHWGKEWTQIPSVKKHLLRDEELKKNVRKFWADYQSIAKQKQFDAVKNLETFSNEAYRQLIKNAIPELNI